MTDSDLTLRIEHASGAVSELVVPTPVAVDEQQPTLASIRTLRGLGLLSRAEATVFRAEWRDVQRQLDPVDDAFFIEDSAGTDIFGGRLDDAQERGATVSVQLDSFERDALDTTPLASFSRSATADDTIATDLIGEMPSAVTAGTVEQTTSSLDFSVEQTPPAVALRALAATTGAEVNFRPDGTVDYVAKRGETRLAVVSPSAGAVIGEPRIRRTTREDTTDVRVVSSSDPSVFADSNVRPPGVRKVFETEELDSTSTSRLQTRADTLAAEIAGAPQYLEVELGIDPEALPVAPAVGDRVPLSLPASGVDQQLRVIERDRVIDAGGDRLDRVLVSNRNLTLRR